ncbi:hypothetical protein VNO80_30421 [Phaseolus coccineus]|uniref:Thioredoxin domain-containing protein n=1 Tax=Phaseolus coccineus TaxID=3886 RepID=A0AAN9LD61_PHACN
MDIFMQSQDVAQDFGVVCTPEFFLFKKARRRPFELVYHGQFDDSRPSIKDMRDSDDDNAKSEEEGSLESKNEDDNEASN